MTPALHALKNRFPKAKLTAVVNDFTAPMLENNPDIDQIWQRKFQGRLWSDWQLACSIRRANFDLTVDFTGGDRSAVYSALSGARQRWAVDKGRGFAGWKHRAITHPVLLPGQTRHQVHRHLALVEKLGATNPAPQPALHLTSQETDWARRQLPSDGRPTVVAHFIANWLFKCWEDAKAAQVVDWLHTELGAHVWLTSGPAEKEQERARAILSLCQTQPEPHIGTLSLRQLAGLISVSRLCVGVDSAPMHMAAALGTPCVTLFGPTLDMVWAPMGQNALVVREPCHCIESGEKQCAHNATRDCFLNLQPTSVQQSIIELWQTSNSNHG